MRHEADAFEEGHRAVVPRLDQAGDDLDPEPLEPLLDRVEEALADPEASVGRGDGKAIDPPLATVVGAEDGADGR